MIGQSREMRAIFERVRQTTGARNKDIRRALKLIVDTDGSEPKAVARARIAGELRLPEQRALAIVDALITEGERVSQSAMRRNPGGAR
jgi:hypothetical protein